MNVNELPEKWIRDEFDEAFKIVKDPTKRSRAIIGAIRKGNYVLAYYLTTCPEWIIESLKQPKLK